MSELLSEMPAEGMDLELLAEAIGKYLKIVTGEKPKFLNKLQKMKELLEKEIESSNIQEYFWNVSQKNERMELFLGDVKNKSKAQYVAYFSFRDQSFCCRCIPFVPKNKIDDFLEFGIMRNDVLIDLFKKQQSKEQREEFSV